MDQDATTHQRFIVIIDEAGYSRRVEYCEACSNFAEAVRQLGVTAIEAGRNMRRALAALNNGRARLTPLRLYPRRGYLADTPYVLQTPRRGPILESHMMLSTYIKWRWAPLVFEEHSSAHRLPI